MGETSVRTGAQQIFIHALDRGRDSTPPATTGHTSTTVFTNRVPDGADRHGRQLAPARSWLESAALRLATAIG
jgi:hypothetical protein